MKDSFFTRSNTPPPEDFTAAMLPQTRRKQLGKILKTRLISIYWVHLLTAVWFLPLLLWNYFSVNYTNTAFGGTAEASLRELPNYCLTVYGTAVFLWMPAFAGLSGGMYVLRRMAWGEHIRVRKDFLKGVKQSGGQFAAIGLVFSGLLAVFNFSAYWLSFYQQVAGGSFFMFILQVSAVLATGILGGVTVFACMMSLLYRVTLWQAWLGGFKLFFGKLFSNSGVLILSFAPSIIPMIMGSFWGLVVGSLVLLLGGLGFAMLMWVQLGLARCDAAINRTDYPEHYLKGLAGGVSAQDPPGELEDIPPREEETEDGFEILP